MSSLHPAKAAPASRRYDHFHRGFKSPAAWTRLLLLARVRLVSPRRRVPRAGPAATSESRHVQALPRRREGAARPGRALPDRDHADARRRRGQDRARSARAPARLPRDRELPRSLAEVEPERGGEQPRGGASRPVLVPEGFFSDGDALLPQREFREAVPVLLDVGRHRPLLLEDVAARDRGLLVARTLCDAPKELVARDLEMLGRVRVA